MDWMQIGAALLLVMMIVFLWPRAKAMMEQSAQETDRDWKGAIVPLAAVLGFVVLLMAMV